MTTAPALIFGHDGEVIFCRRDLADTAAQARLYTLQNGSGTEGMAVDEVEMLPLPEYFNALDVEWGTVHEGTPGAVKYWRFRL